MKVLIVDDDPVSIALLANALKNDYEISSAQNGYEAIRLIKEQTPDLVLLDVMMPDQDGLQVCRSIRADESISDTPVIFITAVDSLEGEAKGLALGAVDYITKPVNIKLAKLRIRNQLAIKRQRNIIEGQNAMLTRQKAELEVATSCLIEREARFRAVTESAFKSIVVSDSAGNIVNFNPAAERLFGHTQSEAIGKPLTMLVPHRYRDRHLAAMTRVASGGQTHVIGKSMEIAGLHNDGSEFPMELSLSMWQHDERFFCGIMHDITERKKVEAGLQEAHAQLRVLAGKLDNVREEEATRLSRALYDKVGQLLSALKMNVVWMVSKLDVDQPALRVNAEQALELVDAANDEVVAIAGSLRPPILTDAGIIGAIEYLADDFEGRFEIDCEVSSLASTLRLKPEQDVALYRILEEALTNVGRHADASRVDISLHEQPGWLRLEIRDNGKSVEPTAIVNTKGTGLLGMKERAEAVGGRFEIEGFPGEGTLVTVQIPLSTPRSQPP